MSYYIDLVIAGVQDYLATKGLAIDENAFSNPDFYFMFEQDPATWNIGQHLISLDGSDMMTNPTYLALNPELFNPAPVQVNLPDENTSITLDPNFIKNATGSLIDQVTGSDIVQLPGAIDNVFSDLSDDVRKILNEIVLNVSENKKSDILSKNKEKTDSNQTNEIKNSKEEKTKSNPETQNDSQQSESDKNSANPKDTQNKENDEQQNDEKQTKTSENKNDVSDVNEVNSETKSDSENQNSSQQSEADKNSDNQKDAQNKENDERQTKTSENADDTVDEEKVNSETKSNPETQNNSQQSESDKNSDNQRVKEETEEIHSDDTQIVETEQEPEVKEEPIVVKTTTDTTKTVDKKTEVKTVDLSLDSLNKKTKRLNDLHQKLLEEANKIKTDEKETDDMDVNLMGLNEFETKVLTPEMMKAVQNFKTSTFDVDNGFNLLITDADGKPSSLFYGEKDGIYYRLDDTAQTPIDMTKSQLKLTEKEYQACLKKLNEQEIQNDDTDTIDDLKVAGMEAGTYLPEQQVVSESQPQPVNAPQQQVYAPQTQQVGSALTPEQQAYARQANIQQPQTQSLTSEQQAQQVQQQQMQAQQQALQREQEKKEEEKANFLVKTGSWIQENIFDTIGGFIPIPFLGKGIKMIGNVFTGLLKTIGHIFDGNWKKMASDGWSWLKDTAIVGGATFGIYKLGKSLDWWGKDKAKQSTSSLSSNNLTDEQVAELAQKIVTGKSGVLASATKPLTTLANAQNNALENSGASSMLRKTASVATQNETVTDIMTQNTKTMG